MTFLSDKALDRLRSSEPPDLSGTLYTLRELIACGGMGAVYAAVDQKLCRRVALKVLDTPDANGELTSRLMREARILAQLEHPGIVPVYDVGTLPDGRVYYAMKLVEGSRLDRYIVQLDALAQRLRLFLRVCDAVAFAHAHGVLHRDLKPANILVGSFGEVWVMDWGLAKIWRKPSLTLADASLVSRQNAEARNDSIEPSLITCHGTVLGTPGYMSPEQARGETEKIDERSDIFSLGKLLQFIAVGGPQGRYPPLARPLLAICTKATAESANARYANVSELAADLSLFLDGRPVRAYSESLGERLGRFYRR
jgi:eukaryotic-like serine/threonine-protein kinase